MIPLPSEAKIKEKSKDGKRTIFEIEGLYPGYGSTIGNSLRRVLLSSLEGSAVTQVKIEGVQHEFSTIDGVMEDVINIILNLKQLSFKVFSDEPQTATLSVKGEKEVTAKDFKFPTQVEIVNGDAPIATLTKKDAQLDLEIKIEKGTGFVTAEELKGGKEQVGQITVDAIFTPVKAVDFTVRNMRVGDRTDFDHVTVDVQTDGSISPEEAFSKSCQTLIEHFEIMKKPLSIEEKETLKKEEVSKEEKPKKEKNVKEDDKSLSDLGLSPKVEEVLKKKKVTAETLKTMTVEDLVDIDGIGQKTAEKILKAVKGE